MTITVTADQRPVAKDDAVTTREDTPVTIDMLANDTDADGDTLYADIACGPAHGRLCRNDDGTWTYLADRNWSGTDTFTYRASDGLKDSALAKVTITVTPVNDAPTARDATFDVREDGKECIDLTCLVSDADGDALSLSLTNPGHGTLTRSHDGNYLYQPDKGFTGSDSFTYTVSDGKLSTTATITLNVGKDHGRHDDDHGHQRDTRHSNNGKSATIQFTSGWAAPGQSDGKVHTYVIHQDGSGQRNGRHADNSTRIGSRIDWSGQAESFAYSAGANLQDWNAINEAQQAPNLLAKLCGLFVKKPH